MPESKRIVILGGGLTGLTAAYKLSKKLQNESVLLLEKTNEIGGTARTIKEGEYLFDLTGHALHLKCDESKKFIFKELGLMKKLDVVVRSAYIYFDGQLVPYPFQYNLSYLDEKQRDYCVKEFIKTQKDITPYQKGRSFKDYCYSFFGKGISDLFMIPYNEKLWSIDLSQLSIDWMEEYVPGPDYNKVLEGAYKRKVNDDSGYNTAFYYPKTGGIQTISNAIYEHVKDLTFMNHPATKIDFEKKIIYSIDRSFKYEYLISTIPLPNLMNISDLYTYADRLKYSVVRAFIAAIPRLDAPKCSWIYVPDASKKIYRVGNYSWFSPSLSVDGKDILYIESASSHDLMESLPTFQEILSELRDLSIFNIDNIELIKIIDIEPAYVTCDLKWRDNISCISEKLKAYNVFLAGRYGSWKYDSMEGAIIDGIASANLISNFIDGIHDCSHVQL
ncbi:MAG: FAD-dependent oxidoreductase [Desulfobacteraceae bacterium]|nr:MAG: FAD-dependent oxidoreductase [Desulfobacteraceae bacterium]